MSNEYEKELEKTIEHLHKVIEEKTKLIDQQKEMLDKFISGELSSNVGKSAAGYNTGYTNVSSYQATCAGQPAGPLNGSIDYQTVFESYSSTNGDGFDKTVADTL